MIELIEKNGAVSFKVRVQPRASRSEIAGEYDGALKLRICSPPVDGKANDECRRLIAKVVGVPARSVEIVVGDSSRDKVIRIGGISAQLVREALRR
jgi:uncharacterized protein